MFLRKFKSFIAFITCLLAIILWSCQKQEASAGNPPDTGFSYSSVASFPVTIQFTNLSVNPVGTTSTYKWDFGDGGKATTTDAAHIYTQPGVYMAMLIQIPSAGSPDSIVYILNLGFPQGPSGSSFRHQGVSNASFSYHITSRTYVASFTNISSGADSYLWKFGDGATSATDSVTVIHTFNNSGVFHVNLAATNSSGTDTTGAAITFP